VPTLTFDELVANATEEAVSKMLGHEVWKAVTFFFDAGKMASQPESFSAVMSKLFGSTAKVLQGMIMENIIAKIGTPVDVRKDREFRDLIQIARAKFQSMSRLAAQR
jgi:hypothetical protein